MVRREEFSASMLHLCSSVTASRGQIQHELIRREKSRSGSGSQLQEGESVGCTVQYCDSIYNKVKLLLIKSSCNINNNYIKYFLGDSAALT